MHYQHDAWRYKALVISLLLLDLISEAAYNVLVYLVRFISLDVQQLPYRHAVRGYTLGGCFVRAVSTLAKCALHLRLFPGKTLKRTDS
jgi:hypothetical protein